MGLPTEGLSAPTLHLPISLQFKESLHLSALGMRERFVAKKGWAVLRILAWLGPRSRKEQEGQGWGTSGPGLGFPGLTSEAEGITADTPSRSDLSQPGNREFTLSGPAEVRWLGGLNQDEPCCTGEG